MRIHKGRSHTLFSRLEQCAAGIAQSSSLGHAAHKFEDVLALFLIVSALGGGYLADRIGRKRLVGVSALVAAAGAGVLLLARDLPLSIVAASIMGVGTGIFLATNWALGTDLVPPDEAGHYLGISNLAGAGAGIVGVGIGGPMADFFNALRPPDCVKTRHVWHNTASGNG